MESSRPYVKYAVRLEKIQSIPFHVEKVSPYIIIIIIMNFWWTFLCVCVLQAVRQSIYGRPGVSYIEIPGNMVTDEVDSAEIK